MIEPPLLGIERWMISWAEVQYNEERMQLAYLFYIVANY